MSFYHQHHVSQNDTFGTETERSQDANPTAMPPDGDDGSSLAQQPYQVSPAASTQLRSNNPFLRNFAPQPPFQSAPLSSTTSLKSLASGSRPVARLERQKTLGDYFSIEEVPRTSYTDQELVDISRLLKDNGRESWSRIPRIYTVLRLIGQIAAIDAFLEIGMNDLWLPFHMSQLPKSLSAFHRDKFIQSQNMVLTKAIDLENDSQKKHTHFKQDEAFPFIVQGKLGSGGYASVDEVSSPLSGRAYARKRFRRTRSKPSEVQSFMTELQILKRINHHHCVELVASYTDSKYFGLLVSPVADCDLSAYYNTVVENHENQKILRSFFGCLAHALQFLHDSKIRHRDIKPENILVKANTVYLSDFGISLDWENLSRSTTTEDSGKSWMYCAPEVAHYEKRNSSSDVWSLGCVFIEMLTILKGFTVHEVRKMFLEKSGRARYYENTDVVKEWLDELNHHGNSFDNEIAQWIRHMVVLNPLSRYSAQAVFLSIMTVTKKCKSAEDVGRFCGDCCFHDHDMESSSEAGSDDMMWAQASDKAGLTPQTSPPVTTDVRGPPLTSPDPMEEIELSLVALQTEEGIHRGNSHPNVTPTKEASSRYVEPAESLVPLASSDITGNIRSASRPTKDVGAGIILQGSVPKQESEEVGNAKDLRIITCQEMLADAINGLQVWPFIEFGGRLPELSPASWESPAELLKAIQSDTPFMEYLRIKNPEHLHRFKTATLMDLAPMIHLLLLNGLDPNNHQYRDHEGRMPLRCIARPEWIDLTKGRQTIIRLLIGFNADFHALFQGESLLSQASFRGDVEFVRILIELGAHLKENTNDVENNPIINAASGGYHEVVQCLLATGHFDEELKTKLKTVRSYFVLIRLGSPVYVPSSRLRLKPGIGQRALHIAAREGYLKIVQLLLEKDVDAGPVCESGLSALHVAAMNGHHLIVQAMIMHGVSFRTTPNCFITPAMKPAEEGHLKVLQVLVDNGLDVDESCDTNSNYRPIHCAAWRGHIDVVKYLLSKGADPTRKTARIGGKTPLKLAKFYGRTEVVKVLEEAVKEWKNR